MLSQVHRGSCFDSKPQTLGEVIMYTIWLCKLAIPRAALVHTLFHILSFTCFMTVLEKNDTKNISANQKIILYFIR